MPEGPEAAYIATFINKEFKNKTLTHINILKGRYINHGPPAHYKEFLQALPLKLLKVEKKGKVIFMHFEGEWCIISKLGMTGWWYSTRKPAWRSEVKTLTFDFGANKANKTNKAIKTHTLIYSDPRSYGTLTFTKDPELVNEELTQLAPDIILSTTTIKVFMIRAIALTQKKPKMPIEELLSEQQLLISGIGNYLKSEILYTCKIAPMRKLESITTREWKLIHKNAKLISKSMYKALTHVNKKTGADTGTDATKDADAMDAYESNMHVYNKKEDPNGNPVKTYSNKNGRTVHWVPEVQK